MSTISIKKTGMYQINIDVNHSTDSSIQLLYRTQAQTTSFPFQKTRPIANTNRCVSRLNLSFFLLQNENLHVLIDFTHRATFNPTTTQALMTTPSVNRMSVLYLGEKE